MASQALSECFSALDGGDYAAAQEHAFTALEKEPQSEAAQFHLALSFFLQKKYRKAERLFSKIRATKDLEVDILYYRGLSEREKEREREREREKERERERERLPRENRFQQQDRKLEIII